MKKPKFKKGDVCVLECKPELGGAFKETNDHKIVLIKKCRQEVDHNDYKIEGDIYYANGEKVPKKKLNEFEFYESELIKIGTID